MSGTYARLVRTLPLLAAVGLAAGCELTETCDPDVDPNCVYSDIGDAGSDTATGCGTLGEGQSRCIDASSMQVCRDGSLRVESCGAGSCQGDACTNAIRYVRIVDGTVTLSGQHPGADIDAIALQSGGQTFYALRVTDSFIPTNVSNRASDVTEILGPPDHGTDACDLTDGAEHWISLAGGEIVVTFDRPIVSGDRITVYECAGAAQDEFEVTIGVSERIEGDFEVIMTSATGTVTATVP